MHFFFFFLNACHGSNICFFSFIFARWTWYYRIFKFTEKFWYNNGKFFSIIINFEKVPLWAWICRICLPIFIQNKKESRWFRYKKHAARRTSRQKVIYSEKTQIKTRSIFFLSWSCSIWTKVDQNKEIWLQWYSGICNTGWFKRKRITKNLLEEVCQNPGITISTKDTYFYEQLFSNMKQTH